MKKGEIKNSRLMLDSVTKEISFSELCSEFMRVRELRNLSDATLKTYKYHSKYFREYLKQDIMCNEINLTLIENYVLYLKNEKNITNTVTINSYLQNVSPFIKYGIEKGYIPHDFNMPFLKSQETFKETYTDRELELLLKNPESNDFIIIRTHAIVWTFASTGIRSRELRELKINNVDLYNRVLTVNQTKNKHARRIPISKSYYDVLDNYLNIRKGAGEDYLFPTIYNEKLAMTTLQDSVKKYCNERGIEKCSLHLFRHTFITNAVNKNVSPLVLQRITGHSTMKELSRYYNARTQDIADIIDEISPNTTKRKNEFIKSRT